ncbi:MAG TPA: molybdopterin cofactor-binding domain-containing protein [Bryobacteraceae bacterium]|jgi:isoquinoline 1-oxidoreductase beta subunit
MRRESLPPSSRRDFLATAGAGLTLGFFFEATPRVAEARMPGVAGPPANTQVNTWLNISSSGVVTLTIGSSEMGQGSFSGLAQILAEDLMVDYSAIQTVQGVPATGTPAVGNSIGTFGSTVIRDNYWSMRQAGAAAREMLVSAAMNIIGDQTRANYTVLNGVITYTPTGTNISYGLVAPAAALLPVPENPPLIPDSQFRYIGTTVNRVDIPSKVNGSAIFGLDIRLPNMVYAVVIHSPVFGGVLNGSLPGLPPGVTAWVPLSVVAGTGRGTETTGMVNAVAAVGTNTWDVWQATLNAKLAWKPPANASTLNDANFISEANAALTSAPPYVPGGSNLPPTVYTVEGNLAAANAAIAGAAKVNSVQYTLPYIPHNALEPLNCTVNYVPGVSCDVYVPTQVSSSVLSLVNQMTGLPLNQINVHTTYLGGALGRKIEVDFVSQALQVAMAVGKPVMLMWPREQNFLRDQFRPMAVVQASAGLDTSGNVLGWSYTNVSPSILAQRGYPVGATGDSQATEGSSALPYNFGVRSTQWISHPSPIPVGFWRSVGMSINTFAVESMIDELAALAGQDPYLYRLGLLTDPRWIGVLQAVAALSNWSAGPASGHGLGMAICTYASSYVAEVVDVSLVAGDGYDGQPALFKVNNVWIALDCYLSVNPGQLQAQLVGGMVHGLNAALYGRQNFVNGVPQWPNFYQNRVIRGDEAPQVAITLIPNPEQSNQASAIGGAGEIGVPCLAPALANAYFKASGKRIRTLPFFPTALMYGLGDPGVL